jgi:hypothetical protein
MKHIPNDGDSQLREIFFEVANRIHVEQTLRRVRMTSVASVNDMHIWASGTINMIGDEKGRPT